MAKSILSSGQQRLAWAVLGGLGFLLANAAYLWLSPPDETRLSIFYQWMLVSHVVVGIVLLLPLAVFIAWHLKRALAMQNGRANVSGIAVTGAMAALLFTGLFMFSQANSEQNAWAYVTHQVLAFVVPLGYAYHRLVAKHSPGRQRVWQGSAVVTVMLAVFLGVHHLTLPEPRPEVQHFVERPAPGVDPYKEHFPQQGISGALPQSPFAPAATRTQSDRFLENSFLVNDDFADQEQLRADIEEHGFAVDAQLGARTCAKCHPDVVEQWAASAHRYSSFNNPFYRASIDKLRAEENGKERSQWCAGCHDPAVMMPGNMLNDIDPTVAESQAGLTCLVCHAMDEVHGVGGNGNYRIADLHPNPYLFADAKDGVLFDVHELLVKSKPDVHKRDMLKPVFRTSEYCATCHKVSLDTPVNGYRWVRGQDQYDAWHDSGVSRNNARTFYLPPKARSCQDCHMPMVDAPLGDMAADESGQVRSHVFPGANTALPFIRGDEESLARQEAFLKTAATVDVFAVKRDDGVYAAPDARPIPLQPGQLVEFQVVVRNKATGHKFPAGTTDSNEAWVHFVAFDADRPGTPLFESGKVDPDSRVVDGRAHFYRNVFVDEHSEEMAERNPQHFRAVVHSKLIGPGTADIVRYRFRVPAALAGRRLAVRARLRYRKFTRAYTEFTYREAMPGRPVPDLPITDISVSQAEFPVTDSAPPPGDVSAETLAAQWTRWNDWGIGLLLQGDTRGATLGFEAVRDGRGGFPDGWRNLARTRLTDGDLAGAIEALGAAEAIAPDNAQTAYFFGKARETSGDLEQAIAAFERARKDFPEDRTIHQSLGRIRYRLGLYEEALNDFLAVLRIDPEDRVSHYHRYLIYAALGDDRAAAEAEKAYLKYKIDESAQKWTNEYRRRHPDVNNESQPVHVHDLVPLSR